MSDQRTPQDHAELFSRYSWVRKRHRLDERRRRFMRVPWAGGAVLMLCVAAAMLLANLPFILIQRYNRPRLMRLAALLRKRAQRKGEQNARTDPDL